MSKFTGRRPSPAFVVAMIALFVALDGPAAAKRLIDGSSIRSGTITGRQVKNRSLGTGELTRGAVTALQRTPNGSVTGVKLAANAVDASKIAPGAVVAAKLGPGAVGAGQIADFTVGAMQIAPGAVTSTKLADGAVGTSAIADGSLTTADIGQTSGSVQIDFAPFEAGQCQTAEFTPKPSGAGQQPNVADDIVAVSPAAGFPDPLIVTANPGAGGTIRIVACYIAAYPDPASPQRPPPLDPAPRTFRYVSFDAP